MFWHVVRERMGLSYSGLHFGHYTAASFCPDLSLLHEAKLSICARKGVALAKWGKGLTIFLEKIWGMSLFINYMLYASWKPTSIDGIG